MTRAVLLGYVIQAGEPVSPGAVMVLYTLRQSDGKSQERSNVAQTHHIDPAGKGPNDQIGGVTVLFSGAAEIATTGERRKEVEMNDKRLNPRGGQTRLQMLIPHADNLRP